MSLLPLFITLLLGFSPAHARRVEPEVLPVNEAEAPLAALPGPEAFQLGPGDRISIRVWRQDDLNMDVVVAPDGTITYPLIGRIQVGGLTYPQLTEKLTASVSTYYADPQVTVNILEVHAAKVFVVGEVSSPAVLQLGAPMTIVEALTMAGGINQYARTSNVLLVRGGLDKPELYTVDVRAILNEGALDQNVYLKSGDIVVVPTKTITNAARFFRDVQTVLAPFVAGSAIYRNALGGGAQGTSSVLE